MIHDRLENLYQYAPIIEHLELIEGLLSNSSALGTHRAGPLSVEIAEYLPSSFKGQFQAHDSATTFVVMLEGSELIGLTYTERCKGSAKNEDGWIFIEDSPISTVITAKKGWFTIIMPREPYVLGIAFESNPHLVKRMTILLEA